MEHKNVERVEIAPLFNLYSRRHKGHTVSTAIKDVIDNHVDSGCAKENIKTNTIQVFIAEDKFRKGKKVLITTDFGFGMFSNKIDAPVWHYIAYCAGTGGSILIIGSAAGVVAMGMEKISFGWYLKNISLLALIGYFSGALFFLLSQ